MFNLFSFSQLTASQLTASQLTAQSVFWCGFGLYCINLLVGIVAQLRLYHFGKAHHVLYFIVCVSAGGALVARWHPAMLVTVLALACIPTTRPRRKHKNQNENQKGSQRGSSLHVAYALAGFLGYAYAAAVELGWIR